MHSWEVLKNMLIKYVSNTNYIPENLVKYTIVLFLISFLMSAWHTQSKYLYSRRPYQNIRIFRENKFSRNSEHLNGQFLFLGCYCPLKIILANCACVKDRHDQFLPVVILALVLKIDMTSFYLFSRILMGQWGHQHARTMLPACCCFTDEACV